MVGIKYLISDHVINELSQDICTSSVKNVILNYKYLEALPYILQGGTLSIHLGDGLKFTLGDYRNIMNNSKNRNGIGMT